MRIASVVALCSLALGLCSCGSRDMTKEEVKSLLNASFDKSPETHKLLTGMASLGQQPEADYFKSTPDGKYQKALEGAGLITITSKGKLTNPSNPKQFINTLDVQLTDAGKKLVTGTPQTVPPPAPKMWATVYENAIFCTREVVDVTSVATNEDFARAQYTYKFGKLTPFAEQYLKTDPTDQVVCNTTKTQEAEATFDRKNDVWIYGSPEK